MSHLKNTLAYFTHAGCGISLSIRYLEPATTAFLDAQTDQDEFLEELGETVVSPDPASPANFKLDHFWFEGRRHRSCAETRQLDACIHRLRRPDPAPQASARN